MIVGIVSLLDLPLNHLPKTTADTRFANIGLISMKFNVVVRNEK